MNDPSYFDSTSLTVEVETITSKQWGPHACSPRVIIISIWLAREPAYLKVCEPVSHAKLLENRVVKPLLWTDSFEKTGRTVKLGGIEKYFGLIYLLVIN